MEDLLTEERQRNSGLLYVTANHNRNFQWLGFDKDRISVYASLVKKNGRYCEIKLFRLNLFTKTFHLCKIFTSTFQARTFFALALSEDGRFFGIIKKYMKESYFIFNLFSLEAGEIVDRVNVAISAEINKQILFRCSLKNLTKLGWLIHFEYRNQRHFHCIVLDGDSSYVEDRPYTSIGLELLRERDLSMERTSELLYHLMSNEKEQYSPSLSAFVLNLDDYREVFMENTRDYPGARHIVHQRAFLPFLFNERHVHDHGTPRTLATTVTRTNRSFKEELLGSIQDQGFAGGYALRTRDVREDGCGHVGTELFVTKFSIGSFPSLERLAAEKLFFALDELNLKLEDYPQHINLSPSLFKRYLGPKWLLESCSADGAIGSITV